GAGVEVAAALDGRAAGDELDEEDAEGVDVALVGELVRAQVLRVHVPGGALPLRVLRLRALAAGHPREPDAAQLRRQRVCQHHVRRSDVPVDDRLLCKRWVSVCDSMSYVDRDVEPLRKF
uniref:Uncharacterized protein n=1 Tax=Oryza brachyantha TaxID=4533 RepID=J3LUC3_ORYBR